MKLLVLLVFLPVVPSVRHSLSYFLTTSSELFPEFVAVAEIDGVQLGSCDSDNRTAEPKLDWLKKLFQDDPEHLDWNTQNCRVNHDASLFMVQEIQSLLNQPKGVHVLQEVSGCELDRETGNVQKYDRFGYDGEDFMSLDLHSETWVYTEKAAAFKNKWSKVYNDPTNTDERVVHLCLQLLGSYWEYGRSSLERKVPPSVSLLRQSPSSPVSCHATGFYPDRAQMFWRKDGEEIHEDVDQGEILPNRDGTFQMRVDLNISPDEDWSRYECVFQLSGVKDDVITTLDKRMIRTNRCTGSNKDGVECPQNEGGRDKFKFTATAIAVIVVILLSILGAIGFVLHKKKATSPPSSPDSGSEIHEKLNPDV